MKNIISLCALVVFSSVFSPFGSEARSEEISIRGTYDPELKIGIHGYYGATQFIEGCKTWSNIPKRKSGRWVPKTRILSAQSRHGQSSFQTKFKTELKGRCGYEFSSEALFIYAPGINGAEIINPIDIGLNGQGIREVECAQEVIDGVKKLSCHSVFPSIYGDDADVYDYVLEIKYLSSQK
jgi:hypothetical protein